MNESIEFCVLNTEKVLMRVRKEKELEVQETAWKMMCKYCQHDMVYLGTIVCPL